MSFRISFSPSWFINILEKCFIKGLNTPYSTRKDTSTFNLTLRLLALMLQSDAILSNEFCSRDGIKSLRSLILSQVELPDVIILLGMFFRIPINLLPLPYQQHNNINSDISEENKKREKTVYSTTEKNTRKPFNFTSLLNVDDCSGPDLSEGGLKSFSIPLFEMLLECVMSTPFNEMNMYERKSDNTQQQQQQQQQQKQEVENRSREIILSAFSQAYITLPSFRRLLQQRAVLQAVITTMAYFSNTSTVSLQDQDTIVPPTQSSQDLPGALREDHFSVTRHSFASPIPNRSRNLFHREILREGIEGRGEEVERDIGSDRGKDRDRVRDREGSNALREKQQGRSNIGNTGSTVEGGSSSSSAESSLYQASANWESLFTQPSPSQTSTQPQSQIQQHSSKQVSGHTPSSSSGTGYGSGAGSGTGYGTGTGTGSDRRVGSFNDLNQLINDKNTIQNENYITDMTDEGSILLNLLSSTITSAITEFFNPSILSTLLLSLPTIGYCEESLQVLIIQTFKTVITEIFATFTDIIIPKKSKSVMSVLSGTMNCLIPLLKTGILLPKSCFGIFEMTITILVKNYEIFSCDTSKVLGREKISNINSDNNDDINNDSVDKEREKEKERERERRESYKMTALLNVKDIGKTARYFASFCLKAMENQEMNSAAECSFPSKSTYSLIYFINIIPYAYFIFFDLFCLFIDLFIYLFIYLLLVLIIQSY